MKIAFVTNTCWNVYNFREGLAKYFLNAGHEVISLSPKDEYTPKVVGWGVQHFDTPIDQTGTNPVKDFQYCRNLLSIFREERPDVALCFTIKSNIYASIAGRLSGTPTICNVSGLGTVFLVKGILGLFAINLYRFAFRHSFKVFFQNQDDKDMFLSRINLDPQKVGLLPGSGINLERFSYSTPKVGSPTKFLMIARIIEEKGVREFVHAAREIKKRNRSAVFTLIGLYDKTHTRSIPEEEFEAWVNEDNLTYLPHSDDIKNHIRNNEVVVLPSYREGTPRTLLEGAAMGRTILSSNVPGCKEVVEDGQNGYLFEVKDFKSLSDKMELYMNLENDKKVLFSKNSRKLVERKFDEKLVIEKYKEAIATIVDN